MKSIAILAALLLLAGIVLKSQPDSNVYQPDSAYRAFVLDSIRLEHESKLAIIEGGKLDAPRPEDMIGVMIPVVAILAVFFFLWKASEARKVVRLAMIEKGMDPGMLESSTESTRKYGAMRIGLLLTGTGLGLLVGMGLALALGTHDEETAFTVLSCSLVFGGAGLIIYHWIISKMDAKSKEH
jgi:hypothetical protein